MISKKRRNGLSSLIALFMRSIKGVLENVYDNKILKVSIEGEDNRESNIVLKKILNLLHSVSHNLKVLSTSPKENQGEILSKIKQEISSLGKDVRILNFPQVTNIQGRVEVANFPKQYQEQIYGALIDLGEKIKSLEKSTIIKSVERQVKMPEIKFPEIKIPDFPKTIGLKESKEILKVLSNLKDEIERLPKNIKIPETSFPKTINIGNFPPQKYPMPVTHISINSVNGFIKSNKVMVSTELTPLPSEVLVHRRSVVVYNNGSQTVEIGGSTFTFGEGMPVPAGTFSPAFDAGDRTIVYGRVISGTADVRVLEISDEDSGR